MTFGDVKNWCRPVAPQGSLMPLDSVTWTLQWCQHSQGCSSRARALRCELERLCLPGESHRDSQHVGEGGSLRFPSAFRRKKVCGRNFVDRRKTGRAGRPPLPGDGDVIGAEDRWGGGEEPAAAGDEACCSQVEATIPQPRPARRKDFVPRTVYWTSFDPVPYKEQ